MLTRRGNPCCWHPVEVPEYAEKYGPMACLREAGHSGPHETVLCDAEALDKKDLEKVNASQK